MSRLYNCPYNEDTTCTHEIPCMGCETFYKVQPLKIEVSYEQIIASYAPDGSGDSLEPECKHIYGFRCDMMEMVKGKIYVQDDVEYTFCPKCGAKL